MRITLGAWLLLIASSASAQTFDCPAGMPASLYPGPAFVPTQDCRGWVTPSHPLAKKPVQPTDPRTPVAEPSAVSQDIVTALDFPRSGSSYKSITSLSGWAVDCRLGSFPPVIRIVETKPDGSLREISNRNFFEAPTSRPDVQTAYGNLCPAVYHSPGSDGRDLGANDRFGWSLPIAAVTEPGIHTFTITFAWPAQNHAGSVAVSVIVQ